MPAASKRLSPAVLRTLDANLNRAREGLRVCEEVARMVLQEPALTRRCQRLRYRLDACTRPLARRVLLPARDSVGDVGRPSRRGIVRPHRNIRDLALANLRRVQEALRVLEEFSRLGSPALTQPLGSLRFRAYTLEKKFHSKFSALRHR
ncbi:MAG: thiamine-phosphate pyrophosphorylase [Candidatus Omnitrophica bacterium]|nr:thiamine-phosphate pyrophosphorylase [Candidatus Omnitrophota bacterium]